MTLEQFKRKVELQRIGIKAKLAAKRLKEMFPP